MNIFNVLSQGRGQLNEENLSAMLGFLLSPKQTHGLGDLFLRRFLEAVSQKCDDKARFNDFLLDDKTINADVLFESTYAIGSNSRIVDVEIRMFKKSSKQINQEKEIFEIHRVAIENKINVQSANEKQLREEFEGIIKDKDRDESVPITMVFLTPSGKHQKLLNQYNALSSQVLKDHRKAWLTWTDGETENFCISALIREILQKEASAEIPPINEYTRHTLKAFVRHIVESSAGSSPKVADGFNIVEQVFVKISGIKYRLEQYANSTIRVINLDNQKYQSALPILRKIIDKKKLSIDLYHGSGGEKNTRNLGKEVIIELIKQGKDLKEI